MAEETSRLGRLASRGKLAVGYLLGFSASAYCLWAARLPDIAPELPTLLSLLGGILGWTVGLLATPTGESERKQFLEYFKAIAAVASGFTLAKLPTLATEVSKAGSKFAEQLAPAHLALLLACFLLGFLFTFVGRKYVLDDHDEQKKKRQKAIADIRAKLVDVE